LTNSDLCSNSIKILEATLGFLATILSKADMQKINKRFNMLKNRFNSDKTGLVNDMNVALNKIYSDVERDSGINGIAEQLASFLSSSKSNTQIGGNPSKIVLFMRDTIKTFINDMYTEKQMREKHKGVPGKEIYMTIVYIIRTLISTYVLWPVFTKNYDTVSGLLITPDVGSNLMEPMNVLLVLQGVIVMLFAVFFDPSYDKTDFTPLKI
jgi:hypothetical protein